MEDAVSLHRQPLWLLVPAVRLPAGFFSSSLKTTCPSSKRCCYKNNFSCKLQRNADEYIKRRRRIHVTPCNSAETYLVSRISISSSIYLATLHRMSSELVATRSTVFRQETSCEDDRDLCYTRFSFHSFSRNAVALQATSFPGLKIERGGN